MYSSSFLCLLVYKQVYVCMCVWGVIMCLTSVKSTNVLIKFVGLFKLLSKSLLSISDAEQEDYQA